MSINAAKSAREPIWQAIWDLVKSVSEAMANPLPNFWKISKNFIEGKYRKVSRRMVYDRVIVHPPINRSKRQLALAVVQCNAEQWFLIL